MLPGSYGGESPVDDLKVEVRIEADILRLQIPVAETVVLHPLDSMEELPGHMAKIMVLKRCMLNI